MGIAPPNRWLSAEHGRVYRRHISANGSIQVDCHTYYIGQAWAGAAVLAQLDGAQRSLVITCNGAPLKVVPLKGLYPDQLRLSDFVTHLIVEARAIEQFRHFHWEQTGNLL